MNVLKLWLASEEGKRQLPSNELHIILNELDNHQVSIKAANTFPMTYTVLTHVRQFYFELNTCCQEKHHVTNFLYFQVVEVTVTFFIICVQF